MLVNLMPFSCALAQQFQLGHPCVKECDFMSVVETDYLSSFCIKLNIDDE